MSEACGPKVILVFLNNLFLQLSREYPLANYQLFRVSFSCNTLTHFFDVYLQIAQILSILQQNLPYQNDQWCSFVKIL